MQSSINGVIINSCFVFKTYETNNRFFRFQGIQPENCFNETQIEWVIKFQESYS